MNEFRDLKDYQQRTLDVLDEFLKEALKVNSIPIAYNNVTGKYLEESLIYQNQDDYIESNVPHICLRVPTGGGKTLIAANAINVIAENLQKNKNNLVVWFVPSSAILTQTIDSLKNENSIYREHLQKYYDSIEVLSVTEALNISKATLDNNLTIIVATFQSFRIEEPEGRKVYSSSGDLMDHFTNIQPSQKEKLLKIENGLISYSLSNVINLRRPIVIVDEAHNAKTDLSFEFLKNINASFILELTATPESKQYPLNVLYNVSAAELKSEKMLKIPMYVFTKVEWKELINDAISKRVELEKNAQDEDRYVRPIMLLQAQPDRKDNPDSLTVKVILDTLLNDFKIPRDHIAIQTSEIKELDNVDLLRSTCEIRYVITVTALKEGWDCPYAYVLCSLAELSSSVAVEQIIGRIIRQPNTEDFSQSNLNNSYAYIYSKNFIATLNNLRDAFVKNGFSQLEMDKLIKKGYANKKQMQLDFKESESENSIIDSINIENGEVTVAFDSDSIEDLNFQLEKVRKSLESKIAERFENDYDTDTSGLDTYKNTVDLDTESTLEDNQVHIEDNELNHQGKEDIETLDTEKPERHSISSKISFEDNKITIKQPLTDVETQKLLDSIESSDLKEIVGKVIDEINQLSPAERGEIFSIPKLSYKHKNLVELKEEEVFTIFDYDYIDRNWDIKNYLYEIPKFIFNFSNDDKNTGVLDINKEGTTTAESIEIDFSNEMLFVESAENWTEEELILWLDMNIRSKDIKRTDSIIFLQRVVKHLLEVNELKLLQLVKSKYKLKENIVKLISNCRELAKKEAYQLFLDEEEFRVDDQITFTYGITDYPYNQLYKPGYIFRKHYYKEIGDLNSKGEEFDCAIYLDRLEEIEYWVRNIPIRRKSSFWLQTSTDKFYPDFVCKLKDGRILVVEYKGLDRWSDDDSKEKRQLGNIWAKNSNGKVLFVMPKGDNLDQINEVIMNGMQ